MLGSFRRDDHTLRDPSHRLNRLFGTPALVSLLLTACGTPPPQSPQEILRESAPPLPLQNATRLEPGAGSTFGETSVRVEPPRGAGAAPLAGRRAGRDRRCALTGSRMRSDRYAAPGARQLTIGGGR